jgi:hypothetical protein
MGNSRPACYGDSLRRRSICCAAILTVLVPGFSTGLDLGQAEAGPPIPSWRTGPDRFQPARAQVPPDLRNPTRGDEQWWSGFADPGGVPGDEVRALQVYNGELVAAGCMTQIGGVPVNNIARCDGSAWQPLGAGLNGSAQALTVYAGKLIATGGFVVAGTATVNGVARWDGTSWRSLGSGTDGWVGSAAVYQNELIVGGGLTTAGTSGAPDRAAPPTRFALHQNRPNPFVRQPSVGFDLPVETEVRLRVFDVNGRAVATLVDGRLPAGSHRAVWDGVDDAGQTLSSGMYLCRLEASGYTWTCRLLIVK